MSKFYLLFALFCTSSFVLQAQQLSVEATPFKLSAPPSSISQQFEHYQTFQIDLGELNRTILENEDVMSVRFQFGDLQDWSVRLIPNDVRSDDYVLNVLTEEGRYESYRSRNKTFVGHIDEKDGGAVRLTIARDFIYGFFRYDGEAYFIEPLRYFTKDAAPDQFIFYKASDVNEVGEYKCAVNEVKQGFGKRIQENHANLSKIGLCYEVEIALAADFSMVSAFGGVTAAENQVLGILNLVQTNYDDDFDDEILFEVVTVFVSSCSGCDPWSPTTDAGSLLDSFVDWGNGGGFGVTYDVATLWTNRNLNGTTIGVAWPGSLCTFRRYNVCENFTSNANFLRVLQAHELGHNFNAFHDADGSPTIMAPSVNNTNSWSAVSQADISSYIAQVGATNSCFSDCAPALPPVAAITAPVNNVCPGSVVPFFDNSTNNPTSWSWNFPGGSPSSSNQQHPTVIYNTPGSYPVILTVSSAVGTDATTLNFDINVTDAGTKYMVYETFEIGPANFLIDNPDGSITWDIVNVGGTQMGNRAMYVSNYDYDAAGQVDALVSLPFDFSGETGMLFEMDYAYRRYNNSLKDKLTISISVDGGNSFPFTAFEGDENGGGNFATAPDSQAPFTPSVQNDWCFGTDFGADCISLDLSSLTGESNVVIKIENETGFGNNMYIDNLRITSNCQPILPPSAAFTANIQEGCTPLQVNFESQSTGMITNYNWSFPGGTPSFSTMANPTITYNTPGIYDVILVVSNSSGSSTAEQFAYVIAQGAPSVDFGFEVDDLTVSFENLTLDGGSYLWDFGDGNSSNAFSPSHTYDSEGEYTVSLTVSNDCGTSGFEQTITVTSPLTAAFSASDVSGCADLEVTFTDESLGNIDSWEWTFEGGMPSASSEQSPTVTYSQAGTFAVTLTVSNDLNETTIEEIGFVTVEDVPSADFNVSNNLGELDVSFTNQSTDANSYSWDFGDGNSSTGVNPMHTYAGDGTYEVQLIGTNDCGSDTATQTLTILTPPTTGFTAAATMGCAPFDVTFTGQPSGNGLTYAWTFEGGEPETSTDPNPTISYITPGTFNVSLSVTNAAGSDTYSETGFVVVEGLPNADFSINSTLGENMASFTNNAVNANAYSWDFGDGNSSTDTAPSHTYVADGTYDVQLIAVNDCGNDTTVQQITILSPPTAGFTTSTTTGCAPFEVSFTGQPTGDGLTYSWSFEGGMPSVSTDLNPTITYSNVGTYNVSLTVTNAAGSDTYSETALIEVGELPAAGFEAMNTLGESMVSFTNNSVNANAYSWDFGDGNGSTDTAPNHIYSADGTYDVQLIAVNDCGNDTITQEISILSPPTAGFTTSATTGCAPFDVSFIGQPTGDGLTYSWTFEGGMPSVSTDANPTITYTNAGTFNVSLTVTNAAGSDTYEEMAYIEVGELPSAAFNANGTLGENEVNFENMSAGAVSYNWDFGDGSTSTETSPSHSYSEDGTYSVQLIAVNDCGNDTTVQEVVILSPPSAGFSSSMTAGCAPFEVSFTGQPTGDGLTYSWVFEGAMPPVSSDPTPTVVYTNAGTFSVSLTVTNAAGSDTYEENNLIEVGVLPTAGFTINNTLGESMVSFDNVTTDAASYSWDFGDGNGSTAPSPSHTYSADGTYDVQLIAQNDCGADTSIQQVTILSPPDASFSADITVGCAPFEVAFSGLPTGDGLTYSWTFEGGTPASSTDSDPMVTYATAGVFGVSLMVTNAAGVDVYSENDFIQVDDVPTADFQINYNLGDNSASFTNTSVNGESFFWGFGDDSSSTAESPSHEYTEDGTYEVYLIAENECGLDTITQEVTIVTPPKAGIEAIATVGCAPFEVQFEGTPLAEETIYSWTFEGGMPATSALQNPVVAYGAAGAFDVTLITTNAAGSDTVFIENYITTQDAPIVAFNSLVNGFTVEFENNTIGGSGFEWDFGDGNGSTEPTPTHVYEDEGVYTVTLTAFNDCDTVSSILSLTISVDFPTAAFSTNIQEGCAPLVVQFESQASNADSLHWSFPGGTPATSNEANPVVTYETPGIFGVSLEAFNPFGSATTIEDQLIVVDAGPTAGFDFSVSETMVIFSNNSQNADNYFWTFGDNSSSMEESPMHVFSAAGTYLVQLIAINPCGADTISQEVLIEGDVPVPAFMTDVNRGCLPFAAQFMDLSTGEPNAWLWTFEGGTPMTSTDQNPMVIYNETGVFEVTLTAMNAFGMATTTLTDYIVVEEAPTAAFSFEVNGSTVNFETQTTGDGVSYEWLFGDGQTSMEMNPEHTYENSGVYEVSLITSNDCGADTNTLMLELIIDNVSLAEWVEQFDVFPNPNDGYFSLILSGNPQPVLKMNLINVVGQILHTESLDFKTGFLNHSFDFKDLPAGMYILQLEAENQFAYKKVIIE